MIVGTLVLLGAACSGDDDPSAVTVPGGDTVTVVAAAGSGYVLDPPTPPPGAPVVAILEANADEPDPHVATAWQVSADIPFTPTPGATLTAVLLNATDEPYGDGVVYTEWVLERWDDGWQFVGAFVGSRFCEQPCDVPGADFGPIPPGRAEVKVLDTGEPLPAGIYRVTVDAAAVGVTPAPISLPYELST